MTVIDTYLQNVEPSQRVELERIRMIGKDMVPDAEEALTYGMPGLKYKGKAFLAFDAHTNHMGIYPCSGQIIEDMKDQLKDYELSKGTVLVPWDKPMPEKLLKELIKARLKQIG